MTAKHESAAQPAPVAGRRNARRVYVAVLAVLAALLLCGHVPGLEAAGALVTPPVALFVGLAFAWVCGQPFPRFNKRMSKSLLQYSVVGLGFGMNVDAALQSGSEGMAFTVVSVAGTMVLGWLLGRKVLGVDNVTSYLISSGTAICGGSAIAAVGPVVKARDAEMSVALGTVFILNALALFIFPEVGRTLGMSQQDFGTWAAIAIHDTSSVVGAGAEYGREALQVATTIKLTRALWIIPLALVTAVMFKGSGRKVTVPWFIFFFVLAMVVNTYVLALHPAAQRAGEVVSEVARTLLTLTLFFIGAGLSRDVLRAVGVRPLVQGVLLWVTISLGTLAYIYCC